MTHEAGVDDGDLEIEVWEQADAELAAKGMSEEDRHAFWHSLKSSTALEHEQLIVSIQEELGCDAETAWRTLMALNGKEV